MTKVETKMEMTPLWTALQKEVAATLHNPEIRDKEADDLIMDLEYKMTPDKIARLRELMEQRATDKSRGEQERRRAELLLFIMSMVAKEQQQPLN
jgi:Holliday junction resolvasome RuvABC DNA-binding subunit